MSYHFLRDQIAQRAAIRTSAVLESGDAPHQVDRTFELPRWIYAITVGCYLAFVAIMAVGFSSPGLTIPMMIFTLFIVAGFGVPAIWTRLSPEPGAKAMNAGQFRRLGISTLTGRLSASEAATQILILPVLIVLWAVAVVIIAAFV
ncbi:hypothetical protein [Pontixanthobacter sp.]|uniref:hypothetical protein n=1 Tax=Pontixanthobacter sp. TaxID=2792078 RepID=UPI003C79A808